MFVIFNIWLPQILKINVLNESGYITKEVADTIH